MKPFTRITQAGTLWGAWALCAMFLWLPTAADAQRGIMIQGVRPEVHIGLGWHGDVSAGFRIDIPIVPDGFLDGVDDEFVLSPGAELLFYGLDDHDHGGDSELGVAPLLAPQWNFYISPDWSLFPELGLALVFGGHHHHGGGRGNHNHDGFDLDFFLGLGARYHFSTRSSFVMRLAWPFGLQLGITF